MTDGNKNENYDSGWKATWVLHAFCIFEFINFNYETIQNIYERWCFITLFENEKFYNC